MRRIDPHVHLAVTPWEEAGLEPQRRRTESPPRIMTRIMIKSIRAEHMIPTGPDFGISVRGTGSHRIHALNEL